MNPELLPISLPVFALIWSAACWDLRCRRIPNGLVLTGVVVGMAVHLGLGGFAGLLDALAGLGVGLAILLPGYLVGTTGAGDVKLMAAVGTFLGPFYAMLAGLASIAVGGLIGLGFLALAGLSSRAPAPWSRYGLMLKTLFVTGRPVYLAPEKGEVMGRKFPFAVSIAVGTSSLVIWQFWLSSQIGVNA
ncbi:A24 family peptidase [Marinobacter sp. SS21]|uniref:A24 family peptidase n=1 Tax=Marinobacter sp. SS21 TaxID=2979460 RepID=UPI00232E9448|nr:A24 family peptidase [Marinobacter sp. SS21]MDC0663750.1 A24 family peptidase [Marinobacter sp. SS21]